MPEEQVLVDLRLVLKFDGNKNYTIQQFALGSLENEEDELTHGKIDRELVCAFVYGLPPSVQELPMIKAVKMMLDLSYDENPETFGQECSSS